LTSVEVYRYFRALSTTNMATFRLGATRWQGLGHRRSYLPPLPSGAAHGQHAALTCVFCSFQIIKFQLHSCCFWETHKMFITAVGRGHFTKHLSQMNYYPTVHNMFAGVFVKATITWLFTAPYPAFSWQ